MIFSFKEIKKPTSTSKYKIPFPYPMKCLTFHKLIE